MLCHVKFISSLASQYNLISIAPQVQLLQQQVTSLADTQSTADERYTRAKADNAVLQARVHMLDEQIREVPNNVNAHLINNTDLLRLLSRQL